MWTSCWWQILCLLAVYCHVAHCQESENYCLPTYNSYGCRTCFKTFESDIKSFEDSQQFCSAQGTDSHLLTFDNNVELSKISFYLMLNNINETFWVGMRYIVKSNQPVLVDINDNDVQLNITFEEGTPQAAAGLCVSIVSRGDGEASFLREDCNKNNPFICTMSSIAMEITSFTSSPDGYGLKDQPVTFSCQFSPVLDPQYTTIEWYRDSQLLATTASDENYVIASFQAEHSGNYSCSVLVTVGDVVLGGARSVEKSVKLAVLPPLSRQPQSATFYTGRIAYIECGINNDTFPEPTVNWLKDSAPIETSGRYFISPSTKSLIIKQIEVGDSGMYTCEVSNVVGTITNSATLTVVDSQANETKILLHPMSLTAEVGTNMTFDCVGQDIGTKGTYQWYYFDANGVTIDNQIKRESDFSSLSFYDVQFATTPAIVRCVYGAVVSGSFLEVSNDAYLTLVEPVQITNYSDNTNFRLGTTAELQCEFIGTPSPDVQWYFKGRPVSDDSRINTIASDKLVRGTTTLTIDNLQFNEIGSYQCVLSNHLQSVRREFDVCGEDGVPDVVTYLEVRPISQTQVKVTWNPPTSVNSDPSLLRYRVYWKYVSEGTVSTADQSSALIPFIEQGYIIEPLSPGKQIAVMVIAISYVGEKTEGVEVAKGQPYGRVPKELPIVLTNRSNNGKDIDVTWSIVTPDLTAGEGYVYRYDIRYYQFDDVSNSIVVEGKNETSYKIQDVDEKAEYTVQVRAVVISSTEPTLTFEPGEWSGPLIQRSIVSNEGSDDDDGHIAVIIAIIVIVCCLLLLVLIAGCMLYYANRRSKRGRYFPAKKERQKGTVNLTNPNIYNNDSTIVNDNHGLPTSEKYDNRKYDSSNGNCDSTNGKCDV